jgi:iron complex outermembrane receptor protein
MRLDPCRALIAAPRLNAPSALEPEQTLNYQIRTTYQNDRISAGCDMYYINLQNYIVSQTNAIGTIFTNNGSAVFNGIEAEATAKLGRGVSLYGNATLNDATFDGSDFPVALNPRSTAAAGPIFQRDGVFGSLLWKYIGPQ